MFLFRVFVFHGTEKTKTSQACLLAKRGKPKSFPITMQTLAGSALSSRAA
jgi:hypothetical protein